MKSSKEIGSLRKLIGGIDFRLLKLDVAELAHEIIRREMQQIRAVNRKRLGGRSPHPRQRKIARRVARETARRIKRGFRLKASWAVPMKHLTRKRTASPILDRLDKNRISNWKPIVARRFRKDLPRLTLSTLNFLDDPVGTLAEFQKLSKWEQTEFGAHLDFGDRHCVDVGAYLVLAEVWPQMAQVFRGGKMSLAVQKVLSAIELDRELGIGLPGVRDHSDVWAFPIRHRRPRGTTRDPRAQLKPQEREKVADELCTLFNDWLAIAHDEAASAVGWELTDDGKGLIANMSGELLDNAERHSLPGSDDGDWSITAFMAARENEDGRRELRCYFAFLSVGQSIAESMRHAPTAILEAGKRYVNQFGAKGPSKDTLMSVLALQDAITSVGSADEAGRGGTGLQDVFEFVGELGAWRAPEADVRATIVSGGTCIRLRSPNLVGTRDAKGKRVQWCNPWNDPRQPPDKDVAFDLPAHFAGTLVSVGFTLDTRLFVPEDHEDDRENRRP